MYNENLSDEPVTKHQIRFDLFYAVNHKILA